MKWNFMQLMDISDYNEALMLLDIIWNLLREMQNMQNNKKMLLIILSTAVIVNNQIDLMYSCSMSSIKNLTPNREINYERM